MDDERIDSDGAAFLDCARECGRCETRCGDDPALAACRRACRECFDACVLCLADLHEGPRGLAATYVACADACDACAHACDRQPGESFRRCAEACRRCAEACRRIAAPSRLDGGAPVAGSPDGLPMGLGGRGPQAGRPGGSRPRARDVGGRPGGAGHPSGPMIPMRMA